MARVHPRVVCLCACSGGNWAKQMAELLQDSRGVLSVSTSSGGAPRLASSSTALGMAVAAPTTAVCM